MLDMVGHVPPLNRELHHSVQLLDALLGLLKPFEAENQHLWQHVQLQLLVGCHSLLTAGTTAGLQIIIAFQETLHSIQSWWLR